MNKTSSRQGVGLSSGVRNGLRIACAVALVLCAGGCGSSDSSPASPATSVARPAKLWGVDANYVMAFEESGRTWSLAGTSVDPIATLRQHGADVFRLRVWVENQPGNMEPGTLDRHARALASRAQAAGLYVIPTLFMSQGWGADGRQDAPADWAALPVDARAELARTWARDAVATLLADGLVTSTYGIGNETDYGFCGAFETSDDLDRLRHEIWPGAAKLMRATAAGIQEATGRRDLEFILHISRAYDPDFAVAFFSTMRAHGVPVELAGLSYYPSDWGPDRSAQFETTVARLATDLALPTFLAEYAYPAEASSTNCCRLSSYCCTNFCCCHRCALDPYPLTEDGQAAFVRDLRRRVFEDPRFAGAVYWSPEEAHRLFRWSALGLFRPTFDGHSPDARPALDALSAPIR